MDLLNPRTVATLCAGLLASWAVARLGRRVGLRLTGLEAVVLGLIAGQYGLALMTPATLRALDPAASFALGTLGLSVGLRLELTPLLTRPTGALRTSLTLLATTALFVGGGSFVLIRRWLNAPDQALVGAAILTAGALLSAPGAIELAIRRQNAHGRVADSLQAVARLSQALAILGFGFALCVFRPDGATHLAQRELVALEWALLATSSGAALGLLWSFFLGTGDSAAHAMPVTLIGMVLFGSGVAYALHVSPLLVGLAMGAATINTSRARTELKREVAAIERPLLAVVLFFAAAAWHLPPLAGWALAAAVVLLRIGARWLGDRALALTGGDAPPPQVGLTLIGQGGLAVAIALNAWQVYDNAIASTVLTCLLVGGFVNELPSDLLVRRALRRAGELPPTPEPAL